MRPLTSNSREVTSNHWLTEGIPLMGFLICFKKDGILSKYHCYVTAPLDAQNNWSYTGLAFKAVMSFMYPIIGAFRHLVVSVDGCASQVVLFWLTFLCIKYIIFNSKVLIHIFLISRTGHQVSLTHLLRL